MLTVILSAAKDLIIPGLTRKPFPICLLRRKQQGWCRTSKKCLSVPSLPLFRAPKARGSRPDTPYARPPTARATVRRRIRVHAYKRVRNGKTEFVKAHWRQYWR